MSQEEQTPLLLDKPPPTSRLKRLIAMMTSEEYRDISIAVLFNVLRDGLWTYWTREELDYMAQYTNDPSWSLGGQQLGQLVAGVGAMAAGFVPYLLLLSYLYKQGRINSEEMKILIFKALISIAAAAVGLVAWNYGQSLGERLAESWFGLSGLNALLASTALTGGFEGPAQWVVALLLYLMLFQRTRQDVLRHPWIYLGLGYILAQTIGAIAGDNWNVEYWVGVFYQISSIPASFLVAVTVAMCNVAAALITKKIINSAVDYSDRRAIIRATSSTFFEHKNFPSEPYPHTEEGDLATSKS